jgi:L-rhamnose mutarotase
MPAGCENLQWSIGDLINQLKTMESKSISKTHDQRVAFKMQLHPDKAAEYERRHNELWPELEELLKETGIKNYSIFLDESTNILFGVLQIDERENLDALPKHPVMKKWWAYMQDIMETNPDNSPVSIPLKEVFFLP